MNHLYLTILRRYLKTYIFLFLTLAITIYSTKIIYLNISEKNLILEKIESCDFDLVAPKGSTLHFILQAINLKPLSDDVLPRVLFKTLSEDLKVQVEIVEAPKPLIDSVWKSDIVHYGKVRPEPDQKERLKELINKKTVAQYIDLQDEKKILTEQFGNDQNQIWKIFLFLSFLIGIIFYLIAGFQYKIYKNLAHTLNHCGYSHFFTIKHFLILYVLITLLPFFILFY